MKVEDTWPKWSISHILRGFQKQQVKRKMFHRKWLWDVENFLSRIIVRRRKLSNSSHSPFAFLSSGDYSIQLSTQPKYEHLNICPHRKSSNWRPRKKDQVIRWKCWVLESNFVHSGMLHMSLWPYSMCIKFWHLWQIWSCTALWRSSWNTDWDCTNDI